MDAQTVRRRRHALGLTKRQCAMFCGMSTAWVNAVECGQRPLLPEHAARLDRVFRILEQAQHAARAVGARSVA